MTKLTRPGWPGYLARSPPLNEKRDAYPDHDNRARLGHIALQSAAAQQACLVQLPPHDVVGAIDFAIEIAISERRVVDAADRRREVAAPCRVVGCIDVRVNIKVSTRNNAG